MHLRLGSVDHDLTTRALVMGVLERPFAPVDATSAASAASLDRLVGQAQALAADGADLLDLGAVDDGVSPVGEAEELGRLLPVVEALLARVDRPLAIDTWRPGVLAGAAAAGVAIVTDRQGLGGPGYAEAASATGVAIVISHNRALAAPPRPREPGTVDEVRARLGERVARARAAGIPDERIIVDAGLDLGGKAPQQSLALLRGSAALADLGPAVLLDASNKRFLGLLLDLDVGERRMAGHAAAALGIARGCRVLRSHDVRGTRRVADVLAAILGARLAQVRSTLAAEVGGG